VCTKTKTMTLEIEGSDRFIYMLHHGYSTSKLSYYTREIGNFCHGPPLPVYAQLHVQRSTNLIQSLKSSNSLILILSFMLNPAVILGRLTCFACFSFFVLFAYCNVELFYYVFVSNSFVFTQLCSAIRSFVKASHSLIIPEYRR